MTTIEEYRALCESQSNLIKLLMPIPIVVGEPTEDWKARALAAEERNRLDAESIKMGTEQNERISMDNFKLTTEAHRLTKALNELRKIGEKWTDQ